MLGIVVAKENFCQEVVTVNLKGAIAKTVLLGDPPVPKNCVNSVEICVEPESVLA
jgi:hypothetical protein